MSAHEGRLRVWFSGDKNEYVYQYILDDGTVLSANSMEKMKMVLQQYALFGKQVSSPWSRQATSQESNMKKNNIIEVPEGASIQWQREFEAWKASAKITKRDRGGWICTWEDGQSVWDDTREQLDRAIQKAMPYMEKAFQRGDLPKKRTSQESNVKKNNIIEVPEGASIHMRSSITKEEFKEMEDERRRQLEREKRLAGLGTEKQIREEQDNEPFERDEDAVEWLAHAHPFLYESILSQNIADLALFARKQYNYGLDNIKAGEDITTEFGKQFALTGLWFRMNDKFQRLKNVALRGREDAVGETVLDTLQDLRNYLRIWQMVDEGNWK